MITLKNIIKILAINLIAVPTLVLSADGVKPAPKADVYVVPNSANLPIDLTYPAVIKSYQDVQVYSRILGVLEKQFFKEGEKVQQGQTLFKIEDDTYQAKVDAANANVNMSKATLNNAQRSWERIKKLYNSKVISTEDRDKALSTYESALASVSLAKAQLKQSQIDLDYTNVKAPISGTIGLKSVDLGDLVSSNPPTKLVTISQNDKVYIEFSMPLSDYKNIKSNLWTMPENKKPSVSVILDNKKLEQKGAIDFIDVNIDQNTSTVKMRATIDNPNNTLMPGSFIRISINDIVQKGVITIPQKALLQNPLGTIVLVEENGKAKAVPVVVGNETGDNFIVSKGDIKSGDKIIVNNFFKIKPGTPVTVDNVINK